MLLAERFVGRHAAVVGGATGAGAAIVRALISGGARVTIFDKNAKEGAALVASLSAISGDGHVNFTALDVGSVQEVNTAFLSSSGSRPAFDTLVVHAGTILVKSFDQTSDDDWQMLWNINVLGMVRCIRSALPSLLASGRGCIVCTSSISGLTASALEIAYCVTKGAILQLVRGIAVEYRDRGLRCNAICPGFIDTPHGQSELIQLAAQGAAMSDGVMHALQGRMCTPEEVAGVVAFLVSNEASFINGEYICIDNGAMART
jgi:NAD(P)-dependent dehydrogenase (short-subunit alcohol dehydrogenase family)